ncbi:hypothetical protein EMCRGX_G032382 [Ephydatia muelleri]
MATHRPGPLKQQNKSHKHGKHKSKSETKTEAKGRVSIKVASKAAKRGMQKADRRNQMNQIRARKREEVMATKRAIGFEGSPPHLVVVISLSSDVRNEAVHSLVSTACGEATPYEAVTTLVCPALKQRFTLVYPPTSDLYALLDVVKAADTLMFVYKAGVLPDHYAQLCLESCTAQGLPATMHVVQGLPVHTSRKGGGMHLWYKAVEKRLHNQKLHRLETVQDATNVLRQLSSQKRKAVLCRDNRPHLLVDRLEFSGQEQGVLKVSGYMRGKPLSVNSLVHIPGVGNCQMSQIDAPKDPYPLKARKDGCHDNDMCTDMSEEQMEEETKILEVVDPSKQQSLVSEVAVDPMEGEQTWPTDEELAAAEAGQGGRKAVIRVPKGMSEYQAAWIMENGSECSDPEEEEEELPPPVLHPGSDQEDNVELKDAASEVNTETLSMMGDHDKYDENIDFNAEQHQLELLKAERGDQLFPDEVDTPLDVPARVRFARYRGLQSFRLSPWDPSENLPKDYARIFQFENFRRTRNRVMRSDNIDGAMPGWYVTLHIQGVPRQYATGVDPHTHPLVISGLLEHENKMSVLHCVLKRTGNYTLPIKSKERLIFHTGVHRFTACPIFSQHTTGDKHKYERFLRDDEMCVASMFAPIMYPPCPILVFKAIEDRHVLVATGSVLSADPRRIVCKKILLSGHPYKVHGRAAVIRYMFFNRDDIMWFKPVELHTKLGRRGHIKEPLGTHGHMKCLFDKPIKSHDTVLMSLYKRVFPKWTFSQCVPCPSHWDARCNDKQEQEQIEMV